MCCTSSNPLYLANYVLSFGGHITVRRFSKWTMLNYLWNEFCNTWGNSLLATLAKSLARFCPKLSAVTDITQATKLSHRQILWHQSRFRDFVGINTIIWLIELNIFKLLNINNKLDIVHNINFKPSPNKNQFCINFFKKEYFITIFYFKYELKKNRFFF